MGHYNVFRPKYLHFCLFLNVNISYQTFLIFFNHFNFYVFYFHSFISFTLSYLFSFTLSALFGQQNFQCFPGTKPFFFCLYFLLFNNLFFCQSFCLFKLINHLESHFVFDIQLVNSVLNVCTPIVLLLSLLPPPLQIHFSRLFHLFFLQPSCYHQPFFVSFSYFLHL
jgi:hypothetical protein